LKKKVVLTDEGFRKLEKELTELKTTGRKEVAEKIRTALSFGDLSENSEYEEAKNEQAMMESRIAQLESVLRDVQILEKNEISTDAVSVGVRVLVENKDNGEKVLYHIVSSSEADPFNFKISDKSPIGKALLMRGVGDNVLVDTPAGLLTLRVLEISQ
jgi:transcription elongation factor GreA